MPKKIIAETTRHLAKLIEQEIKQQGNDADLNHIDTTLITDMTRVFYYSSFTGNISQWNTSNVIYMTEMFYNAKFSGDISRWDVGNVEDMDAMFSLSAFNNDISNWNTESLLVMTDMFRLTPFEGDISKWNVKNVEDMSYAFIASKINCSLNNWQPYKAAIKGMFDIKYENPYWCVYEDIEERKIAIDNYIALQKLNDKLKISLPNKSSEFKNKL